MQFCISRIIRLFVLFLRVIRLVVLLNGLTIVSYAFSELAGKCFWGKIPITLLNSSLETCADLILGHIVESPISICMSPGYLEVNSSVLKTYSLF